MKKVLQITSFILIFTVFLNSIFIFAQNEDEKAKLTHISAESSCLIDAQSKKLLYSKNESKRMPMASTTKIMTAILALESGIPLDTPVSVPKEAVGVEGSSIYLNVGEKISFGGLIYALLLSSANDAAIAIAHTVAGDTDSFVGLMNEKAGALGLTNTHFTNPHGLYDKEHYTTAYELALIMAYAMKNDEFARITATKRTVLPREDDGVRVLVNHNKLLKENGDIIGGKTGFTKKSGRCLVTCAENNGLRLICVTLNAPDDWSDHKKLYDFAFASYQSVAFEPLTVQIPVISGKTDVITVRSLPLDPLIASKSEGEVEVMIEAPRFVFAQVKKGEQLGRVLYILNGKVISASPLVAVDSAEKIKYGFDLFEWLRQLFKI